MTPVFVQSRKFREISLSDSENFVKNKARKKIPLAFILIRAILLLIAVIAALAGIVYVSAYFEGIASILLLLLGFAVSWLRREDLVHGGVLLVAMIGLFAVVGTFFDGAGNFIYNKPLELAFCPAETELVREVTTYETEEGEAYLHKFACYSASQNQTVKEIPTYFSIGLRFFEYVLLGLILFGIIRLSAKFEKPKG